MAIDWDRMNTLKKKIIIASNRGPVTFHKNIEGEVKMQRGSGGLVTALSGIVADLDATWISCAMSPEDSTWNLGTIPLTETGDEVNIQFVSPDSEAYDGYYNQISNPLLWFLQHSMWNLPSAPIINRDTWKAWEEGYQKINKLFATAILSKLEEYGQQTIVMLQDYHLYLAAKYIRQALPRKKRPTILHFTHIPWPGPEYWRILPPAMRYEIIEGLCAADLVGFQTNADALNFLRTCQTYLPRASVKYKPKRIWYRNHATYARSFPISIDARSLKTFSVSQEVRHFQDEIMQMVSGCQMILRIDRIEPSKNIIRGFKSFGELLDLHPEHKEKVSFLALLVPSRMDVPEYQNYLNDLMAAAGQINAIYGTPNWEPIRVIVGENYPRAIAALKEYDILLVNSIADGMNLVAKEGPVVNQKNGILILSERAGAQEQLEIGASIIPPCDVYATAEAMHQALISEPEVRKENAERLRRVIDEEDIHDWFTKQLCEVEKISK